MESSESNFMQQPTKREFYDDENIEQLKKSLPTELWFNTWPLYLYQGFWYSNFELESTIAFQNHFQAQDTDIILTSYRKSGTTWLKSLLYSICNRRNFALSESPLLTKNPHGLVLHFETGIYDKSKRPDLSNLKPPRLFGTHTPFSSLPGLIKESKCKIVYIGRNPLDTFVSSWFFYLNFDKHKDETPILMEEYFDKFCEGKVPYGPVEDHALEYWNASIKWPQKVLFLTYEDLKADTKANLKRVAEFVGCPFTEEEEKGGVVDAIIELCSIRNLKEAVDKSGRIFGAVHNKFFYRKGDVGDWINYLTPAMAQRLKSITEEKFKGTGFTFKY